MKETTKIRVTASVEQLTRLEELLERQKTLCTVTNV